MSDDGVLVLMDLGSALMSTEMAVELMEGDGRVVISRGTPGGGRGGRGGRGPGWSILDDVRAEAQDALRMKASQLGGARSMVTRPLQTRRRRPMRRRRVPVVNAIGLHARPRALVVELAARFDADLRLAKAGAGGAPVSARSLTGLMTLAARKGDELVATAAGPEASDAVAALEELAAGGFGEGVADGPRRAPAAAATVRARPRPSRPRRPSRDDADRDRGVDRDRARPGPPPRPDGGSAARPSSGATRRRARAPGAGPAAARETIEHDRVRSPGAVPASEAEIFGAHLALLDDDALLDPARELIASGATAERAWHDAAAQTAERCGRSTTRCWRERAVDVEDVGARVLASRARAAGPALPLEGIIVGDELTPRETAALDPRAGQGDRHRARDPDRTRGDPRPGARHPRVVGLGPACSRSPRARRSARRRRGHGAGRPRDEQAERSAARAGRPRQPRAPPSAGSTRASPR